MLHGISKVEWWVGLLAIVVLKCIKYPSSCVHVDVIQGKLRCR